MKEYKLTDPQKSIYNTEQKYIGTSIANISATITINEKVNFKVFEQAIEKLIQEYDAFSIKILIKEGQPVQTFNKQKMQKLDLIEVDNEDELQKVVNRLVQIPFSSDDKKLYRIVLFKFPNGSGGCNMIHSHLISDAWGTTLMGDKLIEIYSQILEEGTYSIQERPSYIDYIENEKDYKKSKIYEKDKEYWHNKFNDLPELISTDKENIDLFSSNASRKSFELTKKESKKINNYCLENKISLYTFFLTIYSIYLSRISQNNEVVLGTPILNRRSVKDKNTFGMFINTLPVKIDLRKNIEVVNIFKEVTRELLSVFRHQRYSYMNVLKHIREKHQTNRGLYDVLISFQNAKTSKENTKVPYSVNWDFNGNISETLNIHISDLNETEKLNIYYDYQIEKHDEKYIDSLHNRVLYIISQIVNSSTLKLDDIDIVPLKEKKLIESFNLLKVKYPVNKTIVNLFEDQVKITPKNIAVKINNVFLTYEELNKEANKLARYLKSKGVHKNVPVALRLNKSLEMIISIIAIIKAGGCYLPIDLSYPEERVNFMIEDSGAKLFLTSTTNNKINIKKIEKVLLDKIDYTMYESKNLKSTVKPEDLLYILYTSGSTGKPKGTMIIHRNVVRLMKNQAFQFDFNKKDVWTMFHSVAFDFSVWEMYGALLYGGKLILVPESIAKNLEEFLKLLREEEVTVLNQTPTFFYNLLERELKIPSADLKIRYIIFGGEALKPNLTKPWKTKYNFTKLINMYGITETTVHVTYKELNSDDLESSLSKIGGPIPTLALYIMDEKQRLMPIGIEGEICVSGDGVSIGYLNREDLNREKFIKDPFNPKKDMYRSADSAILGEDGNLFYKGRIDNQVKIRGFRVELEEVEAKILSHPNISKCIVLPESSTIKSSFLVGYIVYKDNKEVKTNDLKSYLKTLLPDYMIPSYFVVLSKIPLTSNGKVDRKYLKTLEYTVEKDNKYIGPRDDFEEFLKRILEKTLKIRNIGIDDDILELGADSLTLMQVTGQLLQKNYTLNIQKFYEEKTIRRINDSRKIEEINIKDIKTLDNNIYFSFEDKFSKEKLIIENVLLTGVTGFLGIHILYDLIINTKLNVYCIIREKNGISPEKRFENKVKYYFTKDYEKILNELNKRIFVIAGDITKEKFNLTIKNYKELGYSIDTVIHSAALVDHYGYQKVFNEVNVRGTKTIISFCKEYWIKLNHISTISVSGDFILDKNSDQEFDEKSLYIGQPYYKNIYVKTKFEAEYSIWKEMQEGLNCSIFRMGNISARYSDGKFQENKDKNAFYNRINNLINLDFITRDILNYAFDMTPVDLCAKFIVELMQYKSSYNRVFHLINNNKITIKKVFDDIGIKHKEVISNKEAFERFKLDVNKLGLINDITNNSVLGPKLEIKTDITNTYLKKLNLEWPKITKTYIKKYLLSGD